MAITSSSLVNETLTLIIDNGKKILTAKSDHPKWLELKAAYGAANKGLLESLISIKSVVEHYSVGKLSVNSSGITYNGRVIHRLDANRVMAFLKANMDYKPLANYMEKLAQNPSNRSIQEAYKFQEHLGLTLTDAGNVIAFKGIQSNDFSVFGNVETVVLQGEVNAAGEIKNSIGTIIEVERSSVDDDYTHECSHGLHAGSMEYAKGHGNKVVLVEINPADFVSVPSDCNFQKLRCCKYKVVGDLEEYLPLVFNNEHTEKTPDTSKFANDSHTKLKRDENGRFLPKADAYCCDECSYPEEDCKCGTCNDVVVETCPKCLRTNDTCICVNEPECTGKCLSCECDKPEPTIAEKMVSLIVPTPVPVVAVTPSKKLLFVNSIYEKLKSMYIEVVYGNNPHAIFTLDYNMAIGMDSLDIVEMIMGVEMEFLIDLNDEYIYDNVKSMTFAEAVDYIIRAIFAQKVKITYESYMQGFTDAINDFETNNQAKYLVNDWDGADTEEHRQYMIGYVYGYKAQSLPKSKLGPVNKPW